VVTNVILTASVFRSERRLDALVEPFTGDAEEAGDSGVDRR
jgi:hypothetical protein